MTGPELREPDLPRTAKVRGQALRAGWTTGTCAAAAAKAAATALRTGEVQRTVEIALPSGRRVGFPVESCALVPRPKGRPAPPGLPGSAERAEAVVVKDAGDDPDVTHGAHLTATVTWREGPGIELDGGVGVGVVTKPGLGLEPGSPAINPVPRAMIADAVGETVDLAASGVRVVISVPGGERMAGKTTNARLGIIGGISILGTTGIVRPFSTASWRASVEQAVSVLAAQGETTVVLCTGGRTEKAAMALLPGLPEVCFIEVGDFTGAALRQAAAHGVRRVVFAGMAGKLAKLAGGVLMTHYTRSKVPHDLLAEITRTAGGSAELAAQVEAANSARHAAELWDEAGLLAAAGTELCRHVAEVLSRFYAEVAAEGPAPSHDEAAVPAAPAGLRSEPAPAPLRSGDHGRLQRPGPARRLPATGAGTAGDPGMTVTVIGCDGSALTPAASAALAGASVVAGARRHLASVTVPPAAERIVIQHLDTALDAICAARGPAAVLASGDPGFFGILRALRARGVTPVVIPAVSSVALAFARLGLDWTDALVLSAHGRAAGPVLAAALAHPKAAILTGPPEAATGQLRSGLLAAGRTVYAAERLGAPGERVRNLARHSAAEVTDPHVLISLAAVLGPVPALPGPAPAVPGPAPAVPEPAPAVPEPASPAAAAAPPVAAAASPVAEPGPASWLAGHQGAPAGWALPEADFEHRDSMITKAEVRALVLARLGPGPGRTIWDVGAGSGSVAVECARFGAWAIAVESDEGQCGRIRRNAAAHGVLLQVVAGRAPDVLAGLPAPDAVFAGGGDDDVLAAAVKAGQPGRVVVTLVSVDRIRGVCEMLAGSGYEVNGTQLQAARLAGLPGGSLRLAAANPVFVIWADQGKEPGLPAGPTAQADRAGLPGLPAGSTAQADWAGRSGPGATS